MATDESILRTATKAFGKRSGDTSEYKKRKPNPFGNFAGSSGTRAEIGRATREDSDAGQNRDRARQGEEERRREAELTWLDADNYKQMANEGRVPPLNTGIQANQRGSDTDRQTRQCANIEGRARIEAQENWEQVNVGSGSADRHMG